jgi:hypothetical protein
MKITTATGEFQIPNDFELEIEDNNPLLSEKGSRSVPVSLPGTPHNLAILGNPQRIAIKERQTVEYNAVIQEGVFRKTGRQIILSASNESIETAFYFKESDFYEKIKTVTMKDVFSSIVLQKGTIAQLIAYLDSVMNGAVTENFVVLPVVTQFEADDEFTDGFGNPHYRAKDVCPDRTDVINNPVEGTLTAAAEYQDVETPAGYGITVFPKLSWTLDTIFLHFGLKLKPSMFHTDAGFSSLVLLNATADTIVKGFINFADVVPSGEVNTFLDCICKKFNCAFEIDTDKETAEFFFLDSVLAERTAMKDLTPFLTESLTVSFDEPKQVKLSNARNLELTTTETASYQQLIAKYPNMRIDAESTFTTQINNLTYRLAAGAYYTEKLYKSDNRKQREWTGSNFFDYYAGGNTAAESFDTPDESVPICYVLLSNVKGIETGTKFVFAPTPYVGKRRHVYTVVETNGEEKSESVSEQKIMFAFTNGAANYNTDHTNFGGGWWTVVERWYHASQLSHDHQGIKIRDTGLLFNGHDGLYNRFWKQTDNAMKNRYQLLKGVFRFNYKEFFELKFNRLYTVNGQPVIIKTKKYAITKDGIKFKELEMITV